ncbi:MAG: hypothetical protein IIB99_06630 [Planctomycetes bacterium]|nr:hypothetical protein [Planctomycetota bacterium]
MIKTPYDAFISNMEIVDTSSYSAEDKARLRSNIFEAVSIRAAYREGFLAGSTLLRNALSRIDALCTAITDTDTKPIVWRDFSGLWVAYKEAEKFVAAARDAGVGEPDERQREYDALQQGVAESTESFKEERR